MEHYAFSWRSWSKWCLCDTCWHLGDLNCEKPALLAEDKSRQLYLHQKTEHVSYKVLHNDQRPQLQTDTESNWYCCCKWYSMLFAFESSELHRAKWTHNPYTSKRAACTFSCTCWDLKWRYYCINKLKVICWMLLQLLAVEKSNSETSFEALLSDTKTEQLLSFSSRSKSMQRRNI